MKARHLKDNIKSSKLRKLIEYEKENGPVSQAEAEKISDFDEQGVAVLPRKEIPWSEATVDDIWLYYFDDSKQFHWFYGDQKLSDIVLSGYWKRDDMANKQNYLYFLISRGQPILKSRPSLKVVRNEVGGFGGIKNVDDGFDKELDDFGEKQQIDTKNEKQKQTQSALGANNGQQYA